MSEAGTHKNSKKRVKTLFSWAKKAKIVKIRSKYIIKVLYSIEILFVFVQISSFCVNFYACDINYQTDLRSGNFVRRAISFNALDSLVPILLRMK